MSNFMLLVVFVIGIVLVVDGGLRGYTGPKFVGLCLVFCVKTGTEHSGWLRWIDIALAVYWSVAVGSWYGARRAS